MEEQKSKKTESVDITLIVEKLWGKKLLFLKIWVVTFILSCLFIFPLPRYYTSSLMLVPESGSQSAGGSFSSLVSSIGLNIGNMSSEDAFFPEVYPDVIASNEFIVGLFNIPIETQDSSLNTDYYTYRTKHEKKSIYKQISDATLKPLKELFKKPKTPITREDINPSRLDFYHDQLVQQIRKDIACSVSKMTNVITISVTDQDPLVSATLADSIRVKLQDFIIDYRTKKARVDADYYKKLCDNAAVQYETALKAYDKYCEAHTNIILQSNISERNRLENEISNALNTYNALNTQYQAAAAKVQEKTPSFTLLQRASVPVKPAGPKRVIFVLTMMVLVSCGTAGWIMRKEIIRWF